MSAGAASYYADLTAQYRHYGQEARGWHYGVWEPDVRSHTTALVRSNERLFRGLDVTPSTHILDVGFGEGGLAVWAAERWGARVTGITICGDHAALARKLAAERRVADRCRFLVMNMDDLAFRPGEFDIVVNQETACYARDKPEYFKAVLKVLKPGGVWRSLDFSVQDAPLSAAEERSYRAVCEGFHIPSLLSLGATADRLRRAGLDEVEALDLTAEVLPTAAMIRRQCYLPLLMQRFHLDWLIYPSGTPRGNRQGHIRAADRYSRGLEQGFLRYIFCAARRAEARSTPPDGDRR